MKRDVPDADDPVPQAAASLMYTRFAAWWPLLSAPREYAEEAAFYGSVLASACHGEARTLLELGSGGGNNASHMKSRFTATLVDAAPDMLRVSQELNPECEHVHGDMRTVRLGRTFDCVFVHDAVSYLTTVEDLERAADTAFVHCRRGGAVLFCPDHTREGFEPATEHGGHDGADGRGLRYLSWTWDPDPDDRTCVVDYALMVREADGSITVEHDRHVEGLFSRAEWLATLEDAGFEAERLLFEHSEVEPGRMEVFVGRKPPG